jgi:putative ABC transport system permease protein
MLCNQWRRNGWIVLELFLVFSIMWYIVDFFSILYLNGRTPEGFDITDTYKVSLARLQPENAGYTVYDEDDGEGDGSREPWRNFMHIADLIRQHPDVEAVSVGQCHYPYCPSTWSMSFRRDSVYISSYVMGVTPDYFRVFRVRPSGGGEPGDLAAAMERGYVISKTTEDELFGSDPSVGKEIYNRDSIVHRIAAVAAPLKRHPAIRPEPCIYYPFDDRAVRGMNEKDILGDTDICFRARPGAGRDFAATFGKEMQGRLAAGNFFLADITPLSELREEILDKYGIYETVQYRTGYALFFLVNAFLGVIGTFWLRVEKRRGEIGVRMAMGASRRRVMTQMITEGLLLSASALVPAAVVWLNLVAADAMPDNLTDFTGERFMLNTVLTVGLVTLAVVMATWYPARRSSRLQPADALHCE